MWRFSQDMNRYVSEFLDTVPTVRDYVSASPLLRNVYVLTIVRKFFFFLDPLGTGITDQPAHAHHYRPSTYGIQPFLSVLVCRGHPYSYSHHGPHVQGT